MAILHLAGDARPLQGLPPARCASTLAALGHPGAPGKSQLVLPQGVAEGEGAVKETRELSTAQTGGAQEKGSSGERDTRRRGARDRRGHASMREGRGWEGRSGERAREPSSPPPGLRVASHYPLPLLARVRLRARDAKAVGNRPKLCALHPQGHTSRLAWLSQTPVEHFLDGEALRFSRSGPSLYRVIPPPPPPLTSRSYPAFAFDSLRATPGCAQRSRR
ncbi:uncharacterized protein SCHCODRAFT_02242619 [Schizophyllum commune H4-8]|uniref:uncharacterized protein n=1 Tax=Schizophyllum commune (strain H4-8 / FGSC 9210) TaxID=578458 RepID=UPI00215F13DC|nr:uncharacterized protein SCHCODRAFT_02242619 [Schizophyllum commune H4-8]KAI5892957.1 hypothetical protein SCHCODRAFT_02242619 [Schizophyllum commune H4-8]